MTDTSMIARRAAYTLFVGPAHLVVLPIAWAIDGRAGVEDVVQSYRELHPVGGPS